jgi:undecaprenyl-diphosphatase
LDWLEWDYRLFRKINDAADDEGVLGNLFVSAADQGDYFFGLSLVLMLFIRLKMALYALMAVGTTVMFSRGIAQFYFRERPFVAHDVNLLLPHMDSNSFPSDHAAAAFAIAMMFFLFSRRIGWVFIGCAAIVSFSRIWVGKHYPTDVIAGTLIGIVLSVVVHRIMEKYRIYNRLAILFNRLIQRKRVDD